MNPMEQFGGLGFALYFLLLWSAVALLISWIGGWSSLAQHFRHTGRFSGPRWYFQSAGMRWHTGYRNCLTVGANHEGLYLSILFLFRIRHPPLFIPWNEISVSRKWSLFYLGPFVEMRLGRELGIPLRVRRRLGDNLKEAAGGSWPLESPG
jgi:hypothetical protein